ncbi:MAG: hypothetical protein IJB49_04000 [Clostridia bacterium]|nr:hypothetical protein [Clostridia bacterium]
MKFRLIALLLLFVCLFLSACVESGENSEVGPDISASEAVSEDLRESETPESEAESSVAESTVAPEEKYDFLSSEYIVVSTRESFGKKYVYEYYLLKGKVAGLKLFTTLSDKESAEEYFELIKEEHPDAELDGLTVIHYLGDNDVFCYGYSLEKLLFVLEKGGYEYELRFDKAQFDKEFAEESGD